MTGNMQTNTTLQWKEYTLTSLAARGHGNYHYTISPTPDARWRLYVAEEGIGRVVIDRVYYTREEAVTAGERLHSERFK